MLSVAGHLAVLLALALSVAGALLSCSGRWFVRGPLYGRRAAFTVAGLMAFAVLIMEIALLGHDYSVRYVADVGGPGVPLYYTIVSLWGALEGSILLWAFVLSVYTVAFLRLSRNRFIALQPWVTGALLTVSAFFLFVIAGASDPFARVNPKVACQTGCVGPNPLLQNHWMMGVHPLLLYFGYVGLAVPFAIAVAALVAGNPGPDVMRLLRRWALVPWIFLSLGIVAGMWWSYAVLGWGGYWSWDPVENASVMPWLVTTAFLHSVQVQERRQMLKAWTLSLIMGAFLLSILGTFLTRSGILASVHAFSQSSIGPIFLTFFAVALGVSLFLLIWRSAQLAAPGVLEAPVCRETAFLFNNLLLVAITFTVLLGTLFPLLVEAVQGTQLSVGAPYFDHVAVPIGFALLFLMGIGPALPWGATRFDQLQYRLLGPVAAGVGVIVVLLLLGVRGVEALATFGAGGFVLYVSVERVVADIRVRRGNTGEGALASSRRLFRANPRRYGGYLAHVGVVLIFVGIAASSSYQLRSLVTLRPGQVAHLGGYTLVYRGWHPHPQSNRMVIQAQVDVSRGGQSLGSLYPSQNYYLSLQQPVVTPAVREEPFGLLDDLVNGVNPVRELGQVFSGRNPVEDLYVVLEDPSRRPNGPAAIQILVNPLVGLIWIGGALLALGGMIALLPAARRRRVPVVVPERVRLQPEEVSV